MRFSVFCLSAFLVASCFAFANAVELRQLTSGSAAVDMEPSWSPDGKWIVFTRFQNLGHAICTISLKDGRMKQLSQSKYGNGNPTWSSDCKSVLYTSAEKEGHRFWRVSVEGGEPVELLPEATYGECLWPAWSPDRRTIACIASVIDERISVPPERDIWLLDVASGNSRRLSHLSTPWISGLTWSPDRKEIAFSCGRDPTIKSISVTQGTIREIGAYRGRYFGEPEWSPDGSTFVVSSGSNPDAIARPYVIDSSGAEREVVPTASDIWIVPAVGGDPVQVTQTVEMEFNPTWSPDGKKIAFVRRLKNHEQHIWIASHLPELEKSDR